MNEIINNFGGGGGLHYNNDKYFYAKGPVCLDKLRETLRACNYDTLSQIEYRRQLMPPRGRPAYPRWKKTRRK